MDIPEAFRWVLLACAALNLFFASRALLRLGRSAAGRRTGPALEAADHLLGAVLIAALVAPGEHPAIAFGALTLLGPVILWQLVRDARARKEAKGPAVPEDGQTPAAAG